MLLVALIIKLNEAAFYVLFLYPCRAVALLQGFGQNLLGRWFDSVLKLGELGFGCASTACKSDATFLF